MAKYISYILLLLFAVSCVPVYEDGAQEPAPKRYEIYDFSTSKVNTTTEWMSCEIHDIDIKPGARIDSIIFEAGLRSQFDEEHCIARLYNYTEDKPIPGAIVQSRVSYVIHTMRTGDIQRTFPKGPAQIGAQFRSTADNHFTGLTTVKVIVYFTQD